MSRTVGLQRGSKTLTVSTKNGVPPPHIQLPVGDTKQSWSEHALTRIQELDDYVAHLESTREMAGGTAKRIRHHLSTAQQTAQAKGNRFAWVAKPVAVERVMTHIDAAEAAILKAAPRDHVTAQFPSILAHVRRHLDCDSPDRESAERVGELLRSTNHSRVLNGRGQTMLVSAFRAASLEERREIMRVRNFRSILWATFTVLTLLAFLLGILGARFHEVIGMCFYPGGGAGRVVCPLGESDVVRRSLRDTVTATTTTPGDVALILVLGASAAALAAAVALRQVKGSSTPFSLPVALAALKLPMGALTALLGLFLMRGQFVPGLSALDSSAQILAWAVIFGYAQQIFTRLVDQRAHTVLEAVGGAPASSTSPNRA